MTVVVDDATLGAEVDPIIGRSLDGRFTVREKLGEGGMGTVYRAYQHSVDREVAIKVVHSTLMSDPAAIKRFLREAKLTSKLNHPNAVGVLDFGQTADGILYLAMELVGGRTLDVVLRQDGVFSASRVARIGMQVCEALEVAHAMQIVHRDLKPANIMLLPGRRDFVKVLDFGLAKSLDLDVALEAPAELPANSEHTSVLGTPAFLPPERASSGASDGRSDLYSLGCVLYLLASGSLPFAADSPTELALAHAQRRPTPLANVPPALAAVIDRLLAKDPDDRFQTAGATRDALEDAASQDGLMSSFPSQPSIDVPLVSRSLTMPSERRRIPRATWFALAALACGVLVVFAATRNSASDDPPRSRPADEPVMVMPTTPAPRPLPTAIDPGPAPPVRAVTAPALKTTRPPRAARPHVKRAPAVPKQPAAAKLPF